MLTVAGACRQQIGRAAKQAASTVAATETSPTGARQQAPIRLAQLSRRSGDEVPTAGNVAARGGASRLVLQRQTLCFSGLRLLARLTGLAVLAGRVTCDAGGTTAYCPPGRR